jgi:hypothetical protein
VSHASVKRLGREASQPTFTGYADFTPVFNVARQAASEVFGPRWDLHPQAFIWARLPKEWVRVRVAGRNTPQRLPALFDPPLIGADWGSLPARKPLPDEVVGNRLSIASRDQKLPVARFWPGGELPIGPEYALSPSAAKTSKPKLKIVHNAEPVKPRRPSGIGLPSGFDRAESDFYIEPRWLVEALLRVESFEGHVHDPFCGGGNIVGACLQQGISATGSDLFDRGFGEQRDAFSITTQIANLISNPPFSRIEEVIRHFLPWYGASWRCWRGSTCWRGRTDVSCSALPRPPGCGSAAVVLRFHPEIWRIRVISLARCFHCRRPAAAPPTAGSVGTGSTPAQPLWTGSDRMTVTKAELKIIIGAILEELIGSP